MSTVELGIVAEIKTRRLYEQAKSTGYRFITRTVPQTVSPQFQRFYRVLVRVVNKIDAIWPTEVQPCLKSIMCLQEGKRHRKGCPLASNYRSEGCPKDKAFSCKKVHNA